jgi:hypothetical protein
MAETVEQGTAGAEKKAEPGGELGRQILRVAWMSILLGVALEVILLVLAGYAGTGGSSPKPFLSDLAQKVSWSFIVCVGLAFGSTAAKARSGLMGALGLISAPLGFSMARSVHKGVNSALGVAVVGGAAFPFLIAGIKAIEYGVLGGLLGYLSKRQDGKGASLTLHLLTGAGIGLTFGLAITTLILRASAAPPTLVDALGKGINEVIFPVGCSLVLYASNALGKRIAS